MKTSSAKAKGRRLQQAIRDALRDIGKHYGLEPDDIESRGMGQNGVDIILSPAAFRVFNLDIEAKNVEKLNVPATFFEHFKKYAERPALKILVHSKNRSEPLVTFRWEDFLEILAATIANQQHPQNEKEIAAPNAA